MALAHSMNDAEDEIVCDFAETYNIYNMKGMSLSYVASLFFGLSENSRFARKMSGIKYSVDQLLLANIADSLAFIAWSKTKDAQRGRNKPKSIVKEWLDKTENDVVSFDTPEEFERARAQIIKGA